MSRLGSFIFTNGFRCSCTGSGKRDHVVFGVLYFHKWFSSQFCGLWKQRPCCQGWGHLCSLGGENTYAGEHLCWNILKCVIIILSPLCPLFLSCSVVQANSVQHSCRVPLRLRSCLTIEDMILVKHIWAGQRPMYPIFCLFRFKLRIIRRKFLTAQRM